jgi:uncharacterized protein (TIGR02996 family)
MPRLHITLVDDYTDETHAFVLACIENVYDPLPQLIFADWLDEHDYWAMAEVLRRRDLFLEVMGDCRPRPDQSVIDLESLTKHPRASFPSGFLFTIYRAINRLYGPKPEVGPIKVISFLSRRALPQD